MARQITEGELRIATLRALAGSAEGFMTISELIGKLENTLAPEGRDARILTGRTDTYFSQKVRNLVSHRAHGTSIVSKGYADYDEERKGFTITPAGRAFLETQES